MVDNTGARENACIEALDTGTMDHIVLAVAIDITHIDQVAIIEGTVLVKVKYRLIETATISAIHFH